MAGTGWFVYLNSDISPATCETAEDGTVKKVFLSYSSGYEHLMEPLRRLLEVFEFAVDVFDGPELDAVPEVVLQKIRDADAVVVLYGPYERPPKDQRACDPAKWPYEEALLARGMQKPIAMVLHQGVRLPETLASYATHAKFDFWEPESFLKNAHHIVKYLLDFKRRIDIIAPSNQLFRYKKAIRRKRVLSATEMKLEVYHEVVARHPCKVFHHFVDCGGDTTIPLPDPSTLKYQLARRVGAESIKLALRFGKTSPQEIEYFIDVSPSLEPGQELGYWRSFLMPNQFPLSRAECIARAALDGFPRTYGLGEYGDMWDVFYEIDSISFAIHLPWETAIADYNLRVLHLKTREDNPVEATRCRPCVRLRELPEDSERILEYTIENPLINHSYLLMFELK